MIKIMRYYVGDNYYGEVIINPRYIVQVEPVSWGSRIIIYEGQTKIIYSTETPAEIYNKILRLTFAIKNNGSPKKTNVGTVQSRKRTKSKR